MALTTVSPGLLDSTAQYYSFKNRIINGAMMIDQRNAGASVTVSADNSLTLDRWKSRCEAALFSSYSIQQSTTAPTGFINSLLVTSLTAATISSSVFASQEQRIEGLNMSDFGWGTASASTVTLSFWVRSSVTGTFAGYVQNSAQNRSYIFSYSISAANTFEQKTITIPGDTSGTWLTTNGIGMRLGWNLGTGSTYQTTAGSWASADYRSASSSVNILATNGATFYITGVQLEKGSTATSFDYRPYGTELQLCQRYFEKSYQQGTSIGSSGTGNTGQTLYIGTGNIVGSGDKLPNTTFMVTKRTAPTVNTWSPNGTANTLANMAGTDLATNSCTPNVANDRSFFAYNATSSVTGSLGCVQFQWSASAEL
jgi:hypothetical protein